MTPDLVISGHNFSDQARMQIRQSQEEIFRLKTEDSRLRCRTSWRPARPVLAGRSPGGRHPEKVLYCCILSMKLELMASS